MVELGHLLSRRLGADAFPKPLDAIKADEPAVEDLTASDYERVAKLMRDLYQPGKSASAKPGLTR